MFGGGGWRGGAVALVLGRLQSHHVTIFPAHTELVEGCSFRRLMVRQAHHERMKKDFAIVLALCGGALTLGGCCGIIMLSHNNYANTP